jgi:hypothetical protein
METTQPLVEWAQLMAETVQRQMLAKEHRQQASHLNQSQAETVWTKGMDQVIQTLDALVQALRRTGQFPHLSLMAYARSPQGTTTYMRRGTLLSLRGLREESATLEFEIDSTPPFRADLLAPTVRVITTPQTLHTRRLREAQWCLGVSLHGAIVWQRLNPALQVPVEGSVEEVLRGFLAFLLLRE